MPATNARTMIRNEVRQFCEGLPFSMMERRNPSNEYPRGEWKVIDRIIIPDPRSESGAVKEPTARAMLVLHLSADVAEIDDAIDAALHEIEERAQLYRAGETFESASRKGNVVKITYESDHPRIQEDRASGKVSGPVYIVLTITYKAGRK